MNLNAYSRKLRALAGILTLYFPLSAQIGTGVILGTVSDPGGGAVPNVGVTVTEVSTGHTRRAQTGTDGNYRIGSLSPGTYEISAANAGFKIETVRGIVLQVGQIARVDVALQIGAVVETVSVNAAAPIVDSEQATVGQVIDAPKILELPLNGRDFFQLATLTAGVVINDNRVNPGSYIGGSVSGNGFSAASTNVLLDGVQNTEYGLGRLAISPSIDMIQEFKIQSNTYDAEFGMTTGPQITMVTKRGALAYHGSLFAFFRNDNLDARNFFDRGKLPEFHRAQFGGSFGGKIPGLKKDFFRVNFEGQRQLTGLTIPITVPDAATRNGDFSARKTIIYDPQTLVAATGQRQPFAGNVIPLNRIVPQAAYVRTLWPLPQAAADTNNYVSNPPEIRDNNQYSIRYDRDFSDNDTVNVRYSRVNNNGLAVAGMPVPGFLANQLYPGYNTVASYTHIFSPSTLNTFRFGISQFSQRRDSQASAPGKFVNGGSHGPLTGTDFFAKSQIKGVSPELQQYGTSSIAVSGYQTIGDSPVGVTDSDEPHTQFNDVLTKATGRNTLKVGGGLIHSNFDLRAPHSTRGTITFAPRFTTASVSAAGDQYSALAAFLLGQVNSGSINLGITQITQLQGWWNGFVQDDVKLTPTLTLTFGLRYEVYQKPVEEHNKIVAVDLRTQQFVFPGGVPQLSGTPANSAKAEDLGYPRSLQGGTEYNDFGPRFGFAWRMFGSNKTVLRGGYGLFYSWLGNDFITLMASGPPFVGTAAITSNPDVPAATFENPFVTTTGPTTGGGVAVNSNRTSYVSQYSLGIQRAITSTLGLDIGYVGNSARKTVFRYDFNQPVPGPAAIVSRRPYPKFVSLTGDVSWGNSHYDALQATVRKNMDRTGISVLASYCWSKVLGNANPGTAFQALTYRDTRNWKADYGFTPWSLDHSGSVALLYNLPFGKGRLLASHLNRFADALIGGWTFGAIGNFRTGYHLTVTDAFDTSTSGGSRPDLIANPNGQSHPTKTDLIQRFFKTDAFLRAASYTFGNAGTGIVTGPGRQLWDVSFHKEFATHENQRAQLRLDLFNALNHANFSDPGTTFGTTSFGVISGAGTGRQMQLGFRYDF